MFETNKDFYDGVKESLMNSYDYEICDGIDTSTKELHISNMGLLEFSEFVQKHNLVRIDANEFQMDYALNNEYAENADECLSYDDEDESLVIYDWNLWRT